MGEYFLSVKAIIKFSGVWLAETFIGLPVGDTVAQWLALWPHSKKDTGPLCVESACSPRVGVGFLRVLRFPPTVQRHAGQVDWRL